MTKEECRIETIKHIVRVRDFMKICIRDLIQRAREHDNVKLKSPELEVFTDVTPKLATLTYGTPEYDENRKEMGKALEHHYAHCRHHPEHFENGINDMTLVDLIEMICDWRAAVERHPNGDIYKSIEINQKRFGYDDQFKQILINTAKLFDEIE